MSDRDKKLKILYLAGPGNIISTYNFWKQGKHDPSESNITYSSQFFSVCQKLEIDAYVISTNKDKGVLSDAQFRIEHKPNLLDKKSGWLYHLGQILYGLYIIKTAVMYKADYVLISSGTHWFLLSFLSLIGVKVIPTVHCVLWPKYKARTRVNRYIDSFNSFFFEKHAFKVMSASKEITRQLSKFKVDQGKITEFLPYYLEETFSKIKAPPFVNRPFHILFIGRIERSKGVYDLLDAFNFLVEKGLDLKLEYCGNGSSLDDLKVRTKNNTLVECHGHCDKSELLSVIEKSQVIVVPTTTDFVEGFNQVVVESVLSGRPVVTSDVCPAIEYVLPAAVECKPDDVKNYAENIEKLYLDTDFYKSKQAACHSLQQIFYDETNSWGYALENVIKSDKL